MLIVTMLASAALAAAHQDSGQDQETRVGDVVVEGRRNQDRAREFAQQVAAPALNRRMARWPDRICVSVANFRNDGAQYIVDRISEVAQDIGLQIGEPGCRANIAIVFTDQADALAETLAEENHRAFRPGVGGADRGGAALRRFVESDAPVRWWHVSLPVDSETGNAAVRMPGQDPDRPPVVSTFAASRLNSQIRDDLNKAIIIVDVQRAAGVDLAALADYLAFIALVQVDPDAETAGFDTVLNLFDGSGLSAGMSDWDMDYLHAIYSVLGSPVQRSHGSAQTDAVAAAMARDRRDAQARSEGQVGDQD